MRTVNLPETIATRPELALHGMYQWNREYFTP
jgi:hypothetical protein